jgi:hypothetical protein
MRFKAALGFICGSVLFGACGAPKESGGKPPPAVEVVIPAGCENVISQADLQAMALADQDPVQTFEEMRRANHITIMAPPSVDCAHRAWQGVQQAKAGLGGPFLPTLPGTNQAEAGGVPAYQGETTIAINPSNAQQMVAGANSFFRDPSPVCISPTGTATHTFGTQALYASTDGGSTWTYQCAPWHTAAVGGVTGAQFWFGSDPALAWDTNGHAYASYMLISQNGTGTRVGASIVLARWTNGSGWSQFGNPVVNRIGSTGAFDDKDLMAIDTTSGGAHSHTNRIYVIWDEGNVERVAHTDDGLTWTTVVIGSGSEIGGNLAIGADGTVYATWNNFAVGEVTRFSRSTDGGATWTAPTTIATHRLLSFGANNSPPAQNCRGVNAFPSIGVDARAGSPTLGRLFVVFDDFPVVGTSTVDLNVYAIWSRTGTAWSSPVLVNDDGGTGTQFFPWMAVDQTDSSVNIAWYDTRNDTRNRRTQIFYAHSTNGGVSFEPNVNVTDTGANFVNRVGYSDENTLDNTHFNANQYGDYMGIAASNRVAHVVWTDSRNFYPMSGDARVEDLATVSITNEDFSLACAPSSLSVIEGQNGGSTCTVTSLAGFANPVTLSCTGAPAGVTCAFATNPVTPPTNSTATSALTISVAGSTIPGTYTFQVTGTGSGNTHTTNISLTVTALGALMETVAGAGSVGDGQINTTAGFGLPEDIALDAGGNLFVVDSLNHRVRRIDATTHRVSTVAGTGESGFAGDGAAATSARLSFPHGIAFDASGNLFIADELNGRVRRVLSPDGQIRGRATETISTVAGDGTLTFDGDNTPLTSGMEPEGVTISGGDLFIVDFTDHRIRRVTNPGGGGSAISTVAGNGTPGFSGDGGAPTAAMLNYPAVVRADPATAGNLYVADYGNGRVRYINRSGASVVRNGVTIAAGTINTLAASPGSAGPQGLFVAGGGTLYVGQFNYNYSRVDSISSAGTLTTIADMAGTRGFSGDGGQAASAQIDRPSGIALSGTSLYVSDSESNRVRLINTTSGVISTFAGSGFTGFPSTGLSYIGALGGVLDVSIDRSTQDMYAADVFNNRVVRVQSSGVLTTIAGTGGRGSSGDGGPATSAQLEPDGVVFKPAALTPAGVTGVYVADSLRSVRFVNFGPGSATFFAGTAQQVTIAAGNIGRVAAVEGRIALDGSGNLLISEYGDVRLLNLQAGAFMFGGVSVPAGQIHAFGSGMTGAGRAAVDASGNLFVPDAGGCVVRRIDAVTGAQTAVVGHAGQCGFGGDGLIGTAPASRLNGCEGLAFDASGNLYIADGANNRVREVIAPGGHITGGAGELLSTVAGDGLAHFSGDLGSPGSGGLDHPSSVDFDGAGRLHIADAFNNRVRRIQAPQISSGVNPGTVQIVPGVSVTFGAATTSGGSLVATASLDGPPAQLNFSLGPSGSQLFYDIVFTGAGGGPYTVNIYFDSQFASCTGLALTHFTAGPPCNTGCNVTTGCNSITHVITGQVTSF